jgi:hypothetical protein
MSQFAIDAHGRRNFGGSKGALYRETLQATGFYVGRVLIATAEFAPMPPSALPGYPGGFIQTAIEVRFRRHGGIYRSDVVQIKTKTKPLGRDRAASRRSAPSPGKRTRREDHALLIVRDEFRPAIPRSGWSPPEPVSVSPARAA